MFASKHQYTTKTVERNKKALKVRFLLLQSAACKLRMFDQFSAHVTSLKCPYFKQYYKCFNENNMNF